MERKTAIDVQYDLVTETPQKCEKILKCLESKGFTQAQCLRALAHTGYQSLRQALLWLCLHVNDRLFMFDVPQEFFVQLCINGEFGERLKDFRDGALSIVNWEPSMDNPPCVSILRFEALPAAVPHIHRFFYENANLLKCRLSETVLKLCPSITKDPNLLGLNFADPFVKSALDDFSKAFTTAITQHCPTVTVLTEPRRTYPRADLTVAHSLRSEEFNALCQLYDTCVATSDSSWTPDWSIRLYSRDPRLRISDSQVYEMMTTIEVDLLSPNASIVVLSELNGTENRSEDNGSPYGTPELIDKDEIYNIQIPLSNPTLSESLNGMQQTLHPLCHWKLSDVGLLSYSQGDYVLLVGSCRLPGRQGCPLGINLATGSIGVFNLYAGQRVPQYHTWVLHGSVPISSGQSATPHIDESSARIGGFGMSEGGAFQTSSNGHSANSTAVVADAPADQLRRPAPQHGTHPSPTTKCSPSRTTLITAGRHPSSSTSSTSSFSPLSSSGNLHLQSSAHPGPISHPPITTRNNLLHLLSQSHAPSSLADQANGDVARSGQIATRSTESNSTSLSGPKSRVSSYFRPSCGWGKGRQLFVMRHAERVDVCFGRGWVTRYFDKRGVYRRSNLNLPAWLPPRTDYMDYVLDSPITQVGLFVAAETGRALAEAGVSFTVCYSSPSLRCVQTACELLRAMGQPDLLVRIEPHLFEWFGWYGSAAPRMMHPRDLRACGYQVDVTYCPLSSSSDFDPKETVSDYYDRTGGLIKRLLGQHKSKNACILIVAHASSLDTCTHQLVHHGFRTCISTEEFQHRTSGVPYCGLVVAQENRRWTLVNPPIPNVCSYTPNPDFDWRQLLSPTLCGFAIK